MRVRILPNIIFVSVLLFLSGCSGDPNEEANKLYTEASLLLQSSKTGDSSYSDVFSSYKSAKSRIDRLQLKYPSSNVAVGLLSSNIKISGLTISQFQELEGPLKLLAEAEQFPFSCALLVAKTIEDAGSKAMALAEIAGEYAEAGQKEQAAQVLSQALQTAKTIEYAGGLKAWVLLAISDEYAEAGKFSQALQTAKTIESAGPKAWALAEIAGKYAEAGQKEQAAQVLSQALQTAKTIEDAGSKASALAEIAGKYAEAGEQPSEKDKSILRDITHTISSMSQFWK